jgi:hypothetical protein
VHRIYQEFLDDTEPDADAGERMTEFLETDDYDQITINPGNTQRIILLAANFRKEDTSTPASAHLDDCAVREHQLVLDDQLGERHSTSVPGPMERDDIRRHTTENKQPCPRLPVEVTAGALVAASVAAALLALGRLFERFAHLLRGLARRRLVPGKRRAAAPPARLPRWDPGFAPGPLRKPAAVASRRAFSAAASVPGPAGNASFNHALQQLVETEAGGTQREARLAEQGKEAIVLAFPAPLSRDATTALSGCTSGPKRSRAAVKTRSARSQTSHSRSQPASRQARAFSRNGFAVSMLRRSAKSSVEFRPLAAEVRGKGCVVAEGRGAFVLALVQLATTRWTSFPRRCGVVIIARNVVSIGRSGSERKLAMPAKVSSGSA